VMFQVQVFWVVTPDVVVVGLQRFTDPYYVHLQGENLKSRLMRNVCHIAVSED
jgi:hypothetical protein